MKVYDGNSPEMQEFKQKTKSLMLEGLSHRNKQSFEHAINCFQNILKIFPKDQSAQLQIRQCQELRETELPSDWDGAVILDQK
ncbi:MAG: hypothetical protein ACI86H_001638 [bacterium]|jgi:hypothetical protein